MSHKINAFFDWILKIFRSIILNVEKTCMLFGYTPELGVMGFSIRSRIYGRLGKQNTVDTCAELYALKRIKFKYFYESNTAFKMRILKFMRYPRDTNEKPCGT